MIFQSRYRNHMIVIRPATFDVLAPGRVRPVPQIAAKFRGPQRLFDLDKSAAEAGWDDETKNWVLEHLLSHPKFYIDFFPGPKQQIPEDKQHLVQRKPRAARRLCQNFEYGDVDGEMTIIQCRNEAAAGRDYCAEHDPELNNIKSGLGTTAG